MEPEITLWKLSEKDVNALFEAAAIVDRTIGYVEVGFRNTIDRSIGRWNEARNGSREWFLEPCSDLDEIVRGMSRRSYISRDETPCHDDYVAGSTFGAWTALLPEIDQRRQQTNDIKLGLRVKKCVRFGVSQSC